MPRPKFSSVNQPSKERRKGGRPKKLETRMKEIGGSAATLVTSEEVMLIFSEVLHNTIPANKKLVNSRGKEYGVNSSLKVIAANALVGKKRYECMMQMIERIIGKPKQQNDVTTNGKDIVSEPLVVKVIRTREEIDNAKKAGKG